MQPDWQALQLRESQSSVTQEKRPRPQLPGATEGLLGHPVSVSISYFQVLMLSFSLCSASWLISAMLCFTTCPICFYLTSFRVGQTSKWKSQEKEKTTIPTASQKFLPFFFSLSFPYPTSDLLLQHSLQSVVLSRAPPAVSSALRERICQNISLLP